MDDGVGKPIGSKVAAILAEQESIMSRYQENSELSGINREAYSRTVAVSQEMSLILQSCDSFYKNTLGSFDAALLPVIKNKQKTFTLGTDTGSHFEYAMGWKNVTFDQQEGTVRFLSEETGLDLGGFGKGWAMEKIVGYLKRKGVGSAFISFGESTICGIGGHPLGGPWQVNVPARGKGNSLLIELTNQAISVSGLKVKESPQQKKVISHIYSPGMGQWVGEDKMVLVQSASPLRAEVLSTACSAATDHQKMHILDAFKEERFFVCEQEEWRKGI